MKIDSDTMRRLCDLACEWSEAAHHADANRLVAEAESRSWDAERLGANAETFRACSAELKELLAAAKGGAA